MGSLESFHATAVTTAVFPSISSTVAFYVRWCHFVLFLNFVVCIYNVFIDISSDVTSIDRTNS